MDEKKLTEHEILEKEQNISVDDINDATESFLAQDDETIGIKEELPQNMVPSEVEEKQYLKSVDTTTSEIGNSSDIVHKRDFDRNEHSTVNSWDAFMQNEHFTKSFCIRGVIAFCIYSSVFFVNSISANFWVPVVLLPIYNFLGLPGLFAQLSNGNEEIFMQYANMYLENGMYAILFVTIVPLFWPEIKKGAKALFKKLWTVFLIIPIHLVMIIGSALIQAVVALFVTLPENSVNQQMIEESMGVSIWGNVFPTTIAAPFVEEIIFRAIVASLFYFIILLLLKKSKMDNSKKYIIASVFGILASSFTFGFLHVMSNGDYLAVIPYVVMGMVFTSVYFLSKRNLLYVILLHIYNNAFSIIMFILAKNL